MARGDNLELRAARDRVVDRLRHLGKTAPLRDVEVDGPIVPVDSSASVRIDPGQVDVRYMLRHRDGSAVGSGHARGTGDRTTLSTPPVRADITYRVLARKVTPNEREVYLHEPATIKVGPDFAVPARITSATSRLDREATSEPSDSDPRVTDHGSAVQVEVDRTQVGIDYELVTRGAGSRWVVRSVGAVRGDGNRIVLETTPMFDDVELRIRATRRFDAKQHQSDVLDAIMPLAVRANRALRVSAPEPIVDHAAGATVVVHDSQVGVRYQVVARTLRWDDFEYGADPSDTVIRVTVPNEPDALVSRPPLDDDGAVVPPRLVPVGPEQPGTAGDLTFDVTSVADDTVFVVIATKDHDRGSSVVQIEQATAILTRPQPDLTLSLSVLVLDGPLVEQLRVRNGQPGVLYYFQDESASNEHLLPAYFPEPAQGESGPRGIGRTRIGVDLVVAISDPGVGPLVELDAPKALPVRFDVQAVKARTRVAVPMTNDVSIDADPTIRLDEPDIVTGTKARIVVEDSRPGDRFQRLVDSLPAGNGRNGNGNSLTMLTEPLWADSTIVLQTTRPNGEPGWTIEKLVALRATVWPEIDARVIAPPLNPNSSSPTSRRVVEYGARPDVEIAVSEPGIVYRIVDTSNGTITVVSTRPAVGTGGVLTIALRPLHDDAELRVRVSKTVVGTRGEAERSFEAGATLSVAVRPDPDATDPALVG